MADETSALAGTRIEGADLTGTRFHGPIFVETRVTDAWVQSLDLSGTIRSLVVNGVEVAGFVEAELQRRHPELGYLGSKDVPGMQRAWAELQEIGRETLARARALPASALDESVDGEFSYLQTLRHLLLAVDRWITGPVLDEDHPFHPLGVPYFEAPPEELAPLDLDATPTLDEVLEARAGRVARVDALVRDATDDSLARVLDSPNGGTTTVGDCLRIVFNEEWWRLSETGAMRFAFKTWAEVEQERRSRPRAGRVREFL